MTQGIFHTTCPSCGGPVHSHSASAKTLVCPYCRSLLIRDGAGVHDSGEDSAPFEDYSPLQIGTTGHDQGQNFTIVGRLQARYDAGVWNEWNLYYDDGSSGWLSESGDQYVLTRPATTSAALPRFADIRAGESRLIVDGHTYLAADVRDITLERASAEGELPYPFNGTRHNRVADYRSENHFLTLDYGEDPPEIYIGRGVTLADLTLANIRSDAQILDSAGALKGSRASGNCPHCGAPVDWLRGITPTIICPSCGSDLASDNLIASARAVSAQQQTIADRHSLPLGAEATIHGHQYTLIGLVYKEEIGEGTGWTEYLLYHPQQGFLWLVETDDASEDAMSSEEDDESWYRHELVGLRALSVSGEALGEVTDLEPGVAQDRLVVTTPEGDDVAVPFVAALVPAIDPEAGTVTLDPPGGLFPGLGEVEEAR